MHGQLRSFGVTNKHKVDAHRVKTRVMYGMRKDPPNKVLNSNVMCALTQ